MLLLLGLSRPPYPRQLEVQGDLYGFAVCFWPE